MFIVKGSLCATNSDWQTVVTTRNEVVGICIEFDLTTSEEQKELKNLGKGN